MKAKLKSDTRDVRYVPIDEELYPEQGEDEGVIFYRLWCRPHFVVYQKYKNGVMMGYTVYPEGRDIFLFDQMIKYAEAINGPVLCVAR
jgi:hypothetical protein